MIEKSLIEHIEVVRKMDTLLPLVSTAGSICLKALTEGGKILLCGNGGSAADSQHIAAELSGRFQKERIALSAIALTTDTSALTSIGNDYGFECIFSRQLEAIAKKDDVLIAISTSGNSKNILNAINSAQKIGCKIIILTGKDGGAMKNIGDVTLIIPSNNTARIQEMHILVGHMICSIIEDGMLSKMVCR